MVQRCAQHQWPYMQRTQSGCKANPEQVQRAKRTSKGTCTEVSSSTMTGPPSERLARGASMSARMLPTACLDRLDVLVDITCRHCICQAEMVSQHLLTKPALLLPCLLCTGVGLALRTSSQHSRITCAQSLQSLTMPILALALADLPAGTARIAFYLYPHFRMPNRRRKRSSIPPQQDHQQPQEARPAGS